MQSELLHRQLRELMETIQEQFDTIQSYPGSIPRIELDILLNNTRTFYERLSLLQRVPEAKISGPITPLEEPVATNSAHPDDSVPSPPVADADSVAADDTASKRSSQVVQPELLPSGSAVIPGPRPEIKSMELPRSASRKAEDSDRKAPRDAVGDLFSSEESSFSIKLQEARDQSLPRKPKQAEHLKTLIGINDKFMFINELFDGTLKDYNEAIEILNACSGQQEALAILDNLRLKNLWEFSSPTFQKLKGIVEEYYPQTP